MRSFFEQLRFLEVQPVVYHAMPLSWGSLPSDIICLVAFSGDWIFYEDPTPSPHPRVIPSSQGI